MSPVHPLYISRFIFQKVRWRLTASYLLVTLASTFMLSWWGFIAVTIYLQRTSPGLSWIEVIFNKVFPALEMVLPSALLLVAPASLVSVYFGFLAARWIDLRLANLRRAVQDWQRGDFSVKVIDQTGDEIGAFGQELNAMARDLESLLQDRTDLAALEERTQLARDLHDSVKQQITAASFQIESASALLEKDRDAALTCLLQAGDLIHAAHQELNSIIFELRPAQMKPGSLTEWLQEYTAVWERQNHARVHLESQGKAELPAELQREIFRFVQEALSNVARHSGASEVRIELLFENGQIKLSIGDNGCGFEPAEAGFEPAEAGKGFGLRTMRERIARVGGSLELTSSPGAGTRLAARVPIPKGRKAGSNAA